MRREQNNGCLEIVLLDLVIVAVVAGLLWWCLG